MKPSLIFLRTTLAVALLASLNLNAALIELTHATATYSQGGNVGGEWPVSQAIDGIITTRNGWSIDGNANMYEPPTTAQAAVFETVVDVDAHGMLHFRLVQVDVEPSYGPYHQLGRFSLSYTTAGRDMFADGLSIGGNVGTSTIWNTLDPFSAVFYHPDGTLGTDTTFSELADHSILVGGANLIGYYDIVIQGLNVDAITGFRLDALKDPSLPSSGPGREPHNGNFILTEFQVSEQPFAGGLGPLDKFAAVPEPPTFLVGAMLTLPIGLQALRSLRRRSPYQSSPSDPWLSRICVQSASQLCNIV